VKHTYGVDSHVIAYGGDHAVEVDAEAADEYALPDSYGFSVCRIEPENNVHIVVEAFSKLKSHTLVMVGNWNNSEYGVLCVSNMLLATIFFCLIQFTIWQTQDLAFTSVVLYSWPTLQVERILRW